MSRVRATVSLKPELVEELRKEADAENRSLSRHIENILLRRSKPI